MTVICEDFYGSVWSHWNDVRRSKVCGRHFVIQDKMPIPFFGDVSAYMQSRYRIVTVAINPNEDGFRCTSIKPPPSPNENFSLSAKETEQRLSSYFNERQEERNLPKWFTSYKHILKGAESPYIPDGDDGLNTALHVDLYSAIATTPTWGGLHQEEKDVLLPKGRELFKRLIGILKPDLVFVSLRREEIAHQWGKFPTAEDSNGWEILVSFNTRADHSPRVPAYNVLIKKHVYGRHPTLIVFGDPMRGQPFGEISKEQRVEIGKVVKDRIPH